MMGWIEENMQMPMRLAGQEIMAGVVPFGKPYT